MKILFIINIFGISILLNYCHHQPTPPELEYYYDGYDEELFVNTPATSNGPRLSLSVGIESGDYSLSWAQKENAIIYIVEKSDYPSVEYFYDISSGLETTYFLGYKYEFAYSSFYRIRVEYNNNIGWSNIVKFPDGI